MRFQACLAILLASIAAAAAGPACGAGSGGGSMPSMSAPQYDPAADYRAGVAALEAQRFADAKRAFDRVLAVAPMDASTNYVAGLARVGLGDSKGAKRFFEKAVKYDGGLIAARRELAVTLARLGDKAKAEAELATLNQRAATCAGTCPQADELKAAIETVTAALAQGPQAQLTPVPGPLFSAAAGDSAYLEAVALINERRYEAAIASLTAAERAFGAHPDILTYLGFANRKLGRFAVAEGYYRQALAIAPDHRGATEYYGELMIERGDMAGAKAMLARLDTLCAFGCAEAEELRRWIGRGRAPVS